MFGVERDVQFVSTTLYADLYILVLVDYNRTFLLFPKPSG